MGGVGLSAAGHADVERLGCGGLGDDGVAGVDGEALGGMDGGGVAERQVLGDVVGRQDDALPLDPVGATEEGGDLEAAVVADGGDPVLLPVDRAAAVAVVAGQVPAVAAGLDDVADAGPGPLQAERHAVLVVDSAEADEVGAQLRGEPGHLLVGVDDEQRVLAGEGVGEPGPGGRGLRLLEGAAVEESAVLVVVGQDGLVPLAEPE